MGLGTLVSHFERTRLDSYLILYSKLTSRRIKELNVKIKTTREPEGNKHNTKGWNYSKKIDLITKRKTVGKTQHANLKGKLQTWKLLWYVRGAALKRGPRKWKLKWSTNSEHSSHHQKCKWKRWDPVFAFQSAKMETNRGEQGWGTAAVGGLGELSCAP